MATALKVIDFGLLTIPISKAHVGEPAEPKRKQDGIQFKGTKHLSKLLSIESFEKLDIRFIECGSSDSSIDARIWVEHDGFSQIYSRKFRSGYDFSAKESKIGAYDTLFYFDNSQIGYKRKGTQKSLQHPSIEPNTSSATLYDGNHVSKIVTTCRLSKDTTHGPP
jgi:hypothetical protein